MYPKEASAGRWEVRCEPLDCGNEWGLCIWDKTSLQKRTAIRFASDAPSKVVVKALRDYADTLEKLYGEGTP